MYTSKLLNLVVQYDVDGGVKEEIGLLTTFFDFSTISKASFSWKLSKFCRSLEVLAALMATSEIPIFFLLKI